jgi:hypothetical protein
MNDHDLVRTAIRQIFLKSGYDPDGSLSQRDLEFIRKEIEENTRILISVSTIKRLQKGDFSRIPQVATLNALSVYLGFRNWQDFKVAARNEMGERTVPELTDAKQRADKRTRSISWKLVLVVSVVLLTVIVFGFFNHRNKPNLQNSLPYFSARKITGNAIPNTVVFSYDLANIQADSFFIQPSWDKSRKVEIDKKGHVLTDIYYEPGYHVAKLIANDSVLKTIDVSIPTDAWMVYTSSFAGNKLPQYIKNGKTLADVSGSLTDDVLQKNHISVDENTLFECSYFPHILISNGDNFTCNMRVRLTDPRSAQCPFLMFEVFCQRKFIYFSIPNKGCSNRASAEIGGHVPGGNTTDLPSLYFELQQWNDIGLQVKDKKVAFSINGRKVFETTYNYSYGKIAGMSIISNGFYDLKSIDLEGLDGKGISENGFIP